MTESFDEYLKRVSQPEEIRLESERRAFEDELAQEAVRAALRDQEVHFYEQGLTFLAVAALAAVCVGMVLVSAFSSPEAFWSSWLPPAGVIAGATVTLGSLVLWAYANLQQNRITRLIREYPTGAARPPGALPSSRTKRDGPDRMVDHQRRS